jgi:hypothetical protein
LPKFAKFFIYCTIFNFFFIYQKPNFMTRKVRLIIPGLMALFFLLSISSQGQTVITQWNFNDITPGDISTAAPSLGSGSISLLGGVTHPASGNSGVGSSDPVASGNQAFQTTTYPAQGQNSAEAGIQLALSTVGYRNIILSFDLRLSNTASRWYQIWYTLNGTDYLALGGPVRVGGVADVSVGDSWTNGITANFSSIIGANNNPDFAVRIVSVFSAVAFTEHLSGTAYEANTAYEAARNVSSGSQSNYAGGTMRFDMITFSGVATYFHFGVVDDTRPAWMADLGHTERGLTADENSVYVASRNAGTHVLVLNRLTGLQTGTLNTTGIEGGFWVLNDIEISADGHRVGFNMFTAGGTFKAYLLDETDPAQLLFSTEIAAGRFGDKVTLVGSLEDGSATIFAGNGSATQVLKWTMVPAAGETWEFNNTPEVITLSGTGVASGATPAVTPLPDGTFYWSANGQSVHKFAADGTKTGTIPGSLLATGTNAMKFLGHEGDDEILAVFAYGANNEKARIVRVINGVPEDAELIFDTPTLRGPGGANPNGTGDVAFVPYPDGNFAIYVLSTNVGIGGYASSGFDLEFPVYLAPEPPPTARMQIIHNSADAAVGEVDIFVNGDLFLSDFAFRTATPFVDVIAGVDLDIIVAPAGAGIANGVGPVTVNLTEGETYIAIANGIVSATGYDPATAFSLNVFAAGRETATSATNTDVLVFHGSTDAPTVSVWETGVGAGQIISDFTYGDFEGYLELPTADYILEVRTADGQTTVVAYSAPLSTLGLDGAALTVVASGFLNPANNSNGEGFGLFVALAAGGDLIALPVYVAPDPTARIQIIHNSADAAVEEVDIFVNGDLFLSNFAFRTATPFVDVPAGVDLNIIVAPAGAGIANGVGPVTVNLTEGETYIAIANGIVSATGYDPATAFSLDVFPTGREAATVATNTDVLVFHGSTDAPTVSVWETGVGAGELFTFSYGDFAGYLQLGTADYILEVRTADGETTVVAYSAPLATLGLDGAAITVVASGFLNPANNSAGPAFGLYVALASGGDLIALPVYTETFEVTFNVNMTYAEGFDPATDVVYLTGSIFGWAQPGTQPENQTMSRVGESMVWTKIVELEAGTYAYKYFLNAGWDGGEWQGGDDRVLVVEADMVVNDWFGSLTDPTTITDPSLAQIRIFPVPARTTLYISSPEVIRDLRIIDMLGQVAYSANVAGLSHEVNVGGFKDGIYFIQILTSKGIETRRIQVQK